MMKREKLMVEENESRKFRFFAEGPDVMLEKDD